MHAPALYRESKSPHDDAPLEAFVGPVFELWNPPELLPDPPRDLSRFAHTMTVHPPTPSTFPRDFIEARVAIAAKHGFQCLDVRYRLPTDALELVDVLVELRAAGYEAWAKSAPDDPTLLSVFTRDNPVSLIDPAVRARAREADGADVDTDDAREVA